MIERLKVAVLALLSLVGCKMGSFTAESYFEDARQLEAARAISAGDINRLRSAVQSIDVNQPGKSQMTLLWFAFQEEQFEAIKVLVELGSKPDKQIKQGLGTPIDVALQKRDLRFLKAILDGGFPVNFATDSGTTLLHKAAGPFGASLDHVRLLVDRGANLEAKDTLGDTALSAAIAADNPERAMYLLEKGASIETYTTRGATPAWTVHLIMRRLAPSSELYRRYDQLRLMMIERGAKDPPDSAETVRQWMKSKGMFVDE
ncbi:MAG TPA: ankyrin repeat domain-containing protein [Polyangiales bacterium]|nr:ankyrin repeat domain-containing protein [Polyangiales bacterium]